MAKSRRPKKLPYGEGTWFAVPLRISLRYGVGVVARSDEDTCIFGYFFGPSRTELPSLDELCKLCPQDAVWRSNFGYLGLIEGRWPILGLTANWDREQWPIPPLYRGDIATGRELKLSYYDDTLDFLYERTCSVEEAKQSPYDSGCGVGAVEIELTRLLLPGEPFE